jgi:hypothetical protein
VWDFGKFRAVGRSNQLPPWRGLRPQLASGWHGQPRAKERAWSSRSRYFAMRFLASVVGSLIGVIELTAMIDLRRINAARTGQTPRPSCSRKSRCTALPTWSIEMFAVCSKKESKTTPGLKEVRDKMFEKKFGARANRYLADLRRQEMIE